MPLILRDIVKTIVTDQPDMEIVGELGEDDDLSNAATRTRADFVITSLAGTGLHPSSARLLEARSRVKVIAIAGDGRQAFIYELQPRKHPVGELSPDVLVGVIRKHTTPRLRLLESPRRRARGD
jgi:DNA-binding NarL/FixJ family response regulator